MDVKLSLSLHILILRVDKCLCSYSENLVLIMRQCDRNETEISKLSVVVAQLSQILSVLSF